MNHLNFLIGFIFHPSPISYFRVRGWSMIFILHSLIYDLNPEKGLLPASGTKERGSATQWISFAQSEIEAYLWHSFRATRLLPDLKASEFPISFNNDMAKSGLQALSSHMDNVDYLLGEEFSVVDIIVSWTVNWAIKLSLVEPESSLHDYIARLKEREACALS